MHLIGKSRLNPLKEMGGAVAKWTSGWVSEVTDAHWKHASDVTTQFPRARMIDDERFVFPVGHCSVGIHVVIAFRIELALVADLEAANEH